jgi:hypothetical protein
MIFRDIEKEEKEDRKMDDILGKIQAMLTSKGNTYGRTYHKVGLALGCPPQHSILVRMMEKMLRVNNILNRPCPDMAHVQEEFLDIAAYAALGAFESGGSANNENEEGGDVIS